MPDTGCWLPVAGNLAGLDLLTPAVKANFHYFSRDGYAGGPFFADIRIQRFLHDHL
jgi:hypothetical protein